MNKKTENRGSRLVNAFLAAVLFASALAGCGGSPMGSSTVSSDRPLAYVQTNTPAEKPSASPAPAQDTTPAKAPAPAKDTIPAEAPAAAQDTVPAMTPTPASPSSSVAEPSVSSASAEPDLVEAKGPDMASPEGVTRLGGLDGDQSFIYVPATASVNGIKIDKDHNPYDLTWRYGVRKEYDSRDNEWGSLYQSYVDACDWSLIFDADYYMAQFPMLAVLYHHDKALLLEHYQTVGVHEGRTASAGFCPAVYAKNCDPALKELFGENWECYAFYYMLNYDAEQSVDAAGKASDPSWLSIELSYTQALELEHVNKYRAEVGAAPVKPHPEMMALANFRAWTDAYHGIKAHDWMEANEDELFGYMDWMDMWKYNENTVKHWGANGPDLDGCWVNYRNSQSHYEAMVRANQQTFGTSNCYWSAHAEKVSVCFDLFTREAVPVNTLKK